MVVTSLERTVVDCARTLPPQAGLILADAALYNGASRERCFAILERMGAARGVRRAREIVKLADGGAESPGETRARFVMLRAGLPVPETQLLVDTPAGRYWCDLGLEEFRLYAEYDGVAKYTANGTASAAVCAERDREREIEAVIGARLLRATSATLSSGRFLSLVSERLPPALLAEAQPRALLMA